MDELIMRAEEIARKAHAGQKDKAEKDYINHPLWVSAHVEGGTYEKVAALLHDVIEDTNINAQDLLDSHIPDAVVRAVEILSKEKNESYFKYIARIRKNEISRRVKIADLKHNSQLKRLKSIKIKDLLRWIKYQIALIYLLA